MARPRDDLADQVAPTGAPPPPPGGAAEVLADQVGNAGRSSEGSRRKVSALEANYVVGGPVPFICGNCANFDPESSLCSLVQGPGPAGEVKASDACRLFRPVEAKRAAKPTEAPEVEESPDAAAVDEATDL